MRIAALPLLLILAQTQTVTADQQQSLAERLSKLPAKLVFERYVDHNWELFVCNPDGSEAVNLTNTPDIHELYPQASADGRRICFIFDQGSGRQTVRSVGVINVEGSDRRLVAAYARQPFWADEGRTVGYLPQEFKKFNIVDYYSKGMAFFDLESGTTRMHSNNELHHLYNPCGAANGRWVAATVHAGMGHSHTNLLIETKGSRVFDLGIGGCRPCLSPDNKHIAWGSTDHQILVAQLDLDAADPKVGETVMEINDDKQHKIYHVDWSPDGQFLSFSRGPDGKGDTSKPGTHEAACEMVGVYAKDWDLFVVALQPGANIDLTRPNAPDYHQVTSGGHSNKESDWFPVH